ncbi:MAG: type II secretion system F family protein [Rhodospirillales bacterium]|nr:type II secretion system F family protein [Rhodospirillales bacterium]
MGGPVLLPVVALVLVMLGGLFVLRVDKRDQQLERRIATLGERDAPDPAEADAPRSIRMRQRRRAPLREMLSGLLKVPQDLPGVHVLPPAVVMVLGVGVALGAAWAARLYLSLPGAVSVGASVGLMVARGIFRWETARYADKMRVQMPDMIELLASSVRAGLPISEAFHAVARELPVPTRDEFGRVVREMTLGSTAEAALMAVHHRTGVAEYAIFAVTLGVQARSGGRLAETIQLLADTIRQRMALAQRAHALAAEAKLSAYMLTGLPFFGGAFMAFTQPGYLNTFLHDPRGRRMLLTAGILLTLGQLLMRKMISSATHD